MPKKNSEREERRERRKELTEFLDNIGGGDVAGVSCSQGGKPLCDTPPC